MTVDELVAWFQKRHPEWRERLIGCRHNEEGRELNPYHLEGDCWSHTMMVCKVAQMERVEWSVAIAALLHDLGKPACREVNPANGHVRFSGHEPLSAYIALDILKELEAERWVDRGQIEEIFALIALHALPYKVKEQRSMVAKFRYARPLYRQLLKLYRCDSLGRFATAGLFDKREETRLGKWADEMEESEELGTAQGPRIELLVGPSNSGKSTYLRWRIGEGYRGAILSRDRHVLASGGGKSYSESWNSSDEADHRRIDEELEREFRRYVGEGKDVIVDMMNLTCTSRRRWLENLPKQYRKKATVFLTTYSEIIRRNRAQHPGKFIPETAIEAMMKRFEFPLYDEVDSIQYVY